MGKSLEDNQVIRCTYQQQSVEKLVRGEYSII